MRWSFSGLGNGAPHCSGPGTAHPGFRAWFAGSVVVGSDGCPLTVWHGHPRHVDPFEHFDFDRAIDVGMHFGTQRAAESFGEARPFYLALRRPVALRDPGDWLAFGVGGRGGDVPVLDELAYKGVLDEKEYDRAFDAVQAAKARGPSHTMEWVAGRARASKIVRDLIESKGYDGIVYENRSEDVGSRSWIAFHPWQIKNIYAARFGRTSSIFDGARR